MNSNVQAFPARFRSDLTAEGICLPPREGKLLLEKLLFSAQLAQTAPPRGAGAPGLRGVCSLTPH